MRCARALLQGGLVAVVLAAGCSSRRAHTDELGAKESHMPESLANYSVPLDLREFEVDTAEGGYRGVFLKLSRLPSGVSSTSQSDPPRIIIDIQGPTDTETAEEVFPGGDTLVTHIGVSRHIGGLRVVLDLQSDEAPEYGVFPMADWVVVRIKPTGIRPRPWAHRAS
jgi:AMIN domain